MLVVLVVAIRCLGGIASVVVGADPAAAADRGWARPLRIDVNRARLHELLTVPGLGLRRAEALLVERIRGGPYASVEDLARLPGIGPSTVRALRPYISAGRSPGADVVRGADDRGEAAR